MEESGFQPTKKIKRLFSNDTEYHNTTDISSETEQNAECKNIPFAKYSKESGYQQKITKEEKTITTIDTEESKNNPTSNKELILASTSREDSGTHARTDKELCEEKDRGIIKNSEQSVAAGFINATEQNIEHVSSRQTNTFRMLSSSDDEFGNEEIIKVLDDVHFDQREPQQNHVVEKVLFCDSCNGVKQSLLRGESNIPNTKSMCLDCEQYLCDLCAERHNGHKLINAEYDKNKKNRLLNEVICNLKLENDNEILLRMNKERYVFCGNIDVRSNEDANSIIEGVYVSKEDKMLIVVDVYCNSIKFFNLFSNRITRCIKLSSSPFGVAKIPHERFPNEFYEGFGLKDDSLYLAVTFPMESQIVIIGCENKYIHILYPIELSKNAECREVFYCNGFLITYCSGYDPTDQTIKILNTVGIQVWEVDILNLPGPGFTQTLSCFKVAVHEKSETIYIASPHDDVIVAVNTVGLLLYAVKTNIAGITPYDIHVDCAQNVYVSSGSDIYKVTPDLRQFTKCLPFVISGIRGIKVATTNGGKLYCVSSSSSHSNLTIFQNEPSFISYDQIANI